MSTDDEKRTGFLRATGGMSRAAERWKERAAKGITDAELAGALAYEIGTFGGRCGPGELSLTYQAAGLKIWITREIVNHCQTEPTFQDKTTIAMARMRSEEHTSELQSLMRISYAVFCLKKKMNYKN